MKLSVATSTKILIGLGTCISITSSFLIWHTAPAYAIGGLTKKTFGGKSTIENALCIQGQLIRVTGAKGGSFFVTVSTQIKQNGNFASANVLGYASQTSMKCTIPCQTGECPTGETGYPITKIGTS